MPNDVISKIQLPNGNIYDLRDNNAIKEDLSYSTAAYPYTGQELLFLRNPVTNTNSITDLTTLLSFFTNSGDTDQSALVHYVKTVSLIASTEAQTFEDEKISSSMVVIEYTFSNPLAQYTDLNITTTDGSVTITGTITEATNLTLYFGVAVSVPPTIQVNLGSATADSILKINSTPGVFGVLPVNNGGTGLSAAPSLLVRLSSTTAANIFEQNPRPGVIGTLAIENGGTNANNAADARTNLDITPANIGALALTGGTLTGALTATAFNGPLTGNVTGNCSGSSGSCTGNAANVTGTVAVGHGGTGATTAEQARTNLGVPSTSEMESAIQQSTAKVSNIAFFSETTWSQIYAKLKAGLNDSDGRSIALFTVYAGAISNILTANNFSGYLKGYVTMSGGDSNLYDFFAGALSAGDMFAWRVTASDSAPTISNFRRFVVYSGENGWTNHALSNTSILTYAASVADPSFTTFRTNNTVTGGPVNNEYYFGDVTRYGQNIAIRMSKMGDPTILYMNHSTDNGSSWKGWKKFTGTAV